MSVYVCVFVSVCQCVCESLRVKVCFHLCVFVFV